MSLTAKHFHEWPHSTVFPLSKRLTFLHPAHSRAYVVTDSRYVNSRVLKLNIGFLLAQGVGNHRVMELDLPCIHIDDDLELDYLKGELRLSRNSRGILAQGVLETGVVNECARCLIPILVPVTLAIEELFAFPPSSDLPYSVDESGILDLAPLLREEVILAVPMSVLCRPDCAGLCPARGQNLSQRDQANT